MKISCFAFATVMIEKPEGGYMNMLVWAAEKTEDEIKGIAVAEALKKGKGHKVIDIIAQSVSFDKEQEVRDSLSVPSFFGGNRVIEA